MTPKHLPKDKIIPQDEYDKYVGQMGLQLNNILEVFNCYGLGDHIPYVKALIIELAINFSQSVRGDKHKPIHVIDKPLRRPTE